MNLKHMKPWTEGALRTLHRGCAKRTPVSTLARMLGRSEGSVRQQARRQGLSVGRNQRGVSTARVRSHRARSLGLSTPTTA